MNNKFTIGSVIASCALLGSAFLAPTSAAEISIHGNGSHSDNTIDVDFESNTTINQSNNTDIDNDVTVDNNTGNNKANDNTGGDVSIHTGNADADVSISNHAGTNVAHVNGCCGFGDVDVDISGNGSKSDNSIDLDFDKNVTLNQDNDTDIDNDVTVDNNTGDNEANDNTGGDVSIHTGDAHADVDIHNNAGFNFASIDSCGCHGDLDVSIEGNRSKSDNTIDVDFDKSLYVDQNNDSDIDNNVTVDNNTGNNEANDNTGHPFFSHHSDHDWWKEDHDSDKHDWSDHDWDDDWWNHDGGDVAMETGDADAHIALHNAAGANSFFMN